MSSSLTSWVQSHLTAIHVNDRSEDARSAFYSSFSSNPQITLNHGPISQDDFVNHRLPIIKSSDRPTIQWNGVHEIPANDEKKDEASINLFEIKLSLFLTRDVVCTVQAGIVAGMMTIKRDLAFYIRVGPARAETLVLFSVKCVMVFGLLIGVGVLC
jgi:hypothetical protein